MPQREHGDGEPYPVDVHSLVKGENIDLEALGLLRTKRGSRQRGLELLEYRDHIQRMADDADLVLSLRIAGESSLRVMTDAEAAEYHDNAAGIAVRKLGRQVRKMRNNIDRSKLTTEQQSQHDQNLARRALQYFAVRQPTESIRKLRAEQRKKIQQQSNSDRPHPFRKPKRTE